MSDDMIFILYVNGEGAGFAGRVEVPRGTTAGTFFKKEMAGLNSAEYKIKVNRDITPEDYVLQDGDKVTITPEKVGGSR